ncbi:MAG: hypothetical protein LC790_16620, partial [Actinobacteria bacterium]|nr:hypothetical protein [Actinomycetota bacterium]
GHPQDDCTEAGSPQDHRTKDHGAEDNCAQAGSQDDCAEDDCLAEPQRFDHRANDGSLDLAAKPQRLFHPVAQRLDDQALDGAQAYDHPERRLNPLQEPDEHEKAVGGLAPASSGRRPRLLRIRVAAGPRATIKL